MYAYPSRTWTGAQQAVHLLCRGGSVDTHAKRELATYSAMGGWRSPIDMMMTTGFLFAATVAAAAAAAAGEQEQIIQGLLLSSTEERHAHLQGYHEDGYTCWLPSFDGAVCIKVGLHDDYLRQTNKRRAFDSTNRFERCSLCMYTVIRQQQQQLQLADNNGVRK